ncbi:hypothetical protein ABZ759_13045 [Streptomyces sp. NPDC047860]|uniref:hypothetical protein n=1 Tax=Streptomyces sp. NPDC047860 TaxID=3155743 RepID=UPI0033FC323F
MAWGDALPFDGNAPFRGVIQRSREEIASEVGLLLRNWLETVVNLRRPGTRDYTFNGSPATDLGMETAQAALDDIGLGLARSGHALFEFLFSRGDAGLSRLREALCAALRSGPQIVTITSNDLFVPWGMLYLPADPATRLPQRSAAWDWSGFLGYTHLIEHNLGYVENYHPLIEHGTERPQAGLQFDLRMQNGDAPPGTGPIGAVRAVIETHADVTERSYKPDLAEALSDPRVHDHILVFGAHGCGERQDQRGTTQARLTLTDGESICSSDLEYWRTTRQERLPDPLCFMMVCEGGRTRTLVHEGLGRPLFDLGVGCLIGPEIEIPKTFGSLYTCRFFEEFFKGERAAPVARSLTHEFLTKHATPLGLVFTLLRGIDNRLVDSSTAVKEST